MFPSFFVSLKMLQQKKRKFCVCNFLFLIFISWYDGASYSNRRRKYTCHDGENSMEVLKATTKKARLNAHKIAQRSLRWDFFFFLCNRIHFNIALNARRERERELFYVHEATFSTPESLISYIIFLCAVAKLCSVPFSSFLALQISCPSYNKYRNFRSMYGFSYFYFIFLLSFCDGAMKNMKMFSSFFLLFSLSSFHAKNSVFIMLLLLEPRLQLGVEPEHVMLYVTCWVAFFFRDGKWWWKKKILLRRKT